MAEKHKSKYKKPVNAKSTSRKDLKDYTFDDKTGGLNPKSTGEKQTNVLRKTDKLFQDDGKMYPTYDSDDRLYKDLEDGEYDPKTAAKRLKKRQDVEEKDTIKDKIENLTREGKEQLVREYIRRKIAKILSEQAEPEAPEAPEAPAPEAPEAPAPEAPEAPAPEAPAPEAPEAPAPAPEAPATAPEAPAPEAPAPDAETAKTLDPEAKEALSIDRFITHMKNESGNIARIKSLAKVFNSTFKEAEIEDKNNFYHMLKIFSIKKLAEIQTEVPPKK
jgi:hypothetical protein